MFQKHKVTKEGAAGGALLHFRVPEGYVTLKLFLSAGRALELNV